MTDRTNDPVATLRRVFAVERQLLAEGRLEDLQALEEKKTVALSTLVAASPDAATLEIVRGLAARNLNLLRATQAGIRQAIDLLSGIESARAGLRTYDRNGRMAERIGEKGATTRRA